MTYYIGTSGYQYNHWNDGVFYPQGLNHKVQLQYLAERLNTVEINASFYSIPKPEVVAGWAAKTPKDFKLVLKSPQSVSHRRRLKLHSDHGVKQGIDLLNYFIDGYMMIPAEKRGPALLQIPAPMRIDLPRLHDVLALYKERSLRVAFEIRHESWFTKATLDLLEKYDSSLVQADWSTYKTPLVLTTDFIYVRRHGPQKYSGRYTDRQLTDDISLLTLQPVKEVYVYFNNDIGGHAPHNAMRMLELLKGGTLPEENVLESLSV